MYAYPTFTGFEGFHRFFLLIALFALLDVILKAMALWRSARRGQKWWFVFLLIVNSLGILPVIYLLTHPDVVYSSEKNVSSTNRLRIPVKSTSASQKRRSR